MKVLEVSEGGRSLITSEHLRVVVDYNFYGIPESGVLFHVVKAPARGSLNITGSAGAGRWNQKEDIIFTLVDLNTDQVSRSCMQARERLLENTDDHGSLSLCVLYCNSS